jgi:hypothetical protein
MLKIVANYEVNELPKEARCQASEPSFAVPVDPSSSPNILGIGNSVQDVDTAHFARFVHLNTAFSDHIHLPIIQNMA